MNELIVSDDNDKNNKNTKMSENGFLLYMRSIWEHTKLLFHRPYLFDMLMLCSITFVLYMGIYGFYMW